MILATALLPILAFGALFRSNFRRPVAIRSSILPKQHARNLHYRPLNPIVHENNVKSFRRSISDIGECDRLTAPDSEGRFVPVKLTPFDKLHGHLFIKPLRSVEEVIDPVTGKISWSSTGYQSNADSIQRANDYFEAVLRDVGGIIREEGKKFHLVSGPNYEWILKGKGHVVRDEIFDANIALHWGDQLFLVPREVKGKVVEQLLTRGHMNPEELFFWPEDFVAHFTCTR